MFYIIGFAVSEPEVSGEDGGIEIYLIGFSLKSLELSSVCTLLVSLCFVIYYIINLYIYMVNR